MGTIATLAVSLVAQHQGFSAGMEAAARSHNLFTANVRSARAVIEATKSASEIYGDKVAALDQHLQRGKINVEQYHKALEMLQEGFRKSTGQEGRGFKELLEVSGVAAAAEALMKVGEHAVEAGRELAEFVHHSMESAEQSQRMAEKLGVSIEQMTGLEYAAKLTHTPIEALSTGMEKMLANLADVSSDEGKKAAATLAELGLNAQTLANESPAKALSDLAEAISHVGNSAERMRDVRTLFGRGGAELLPVLLQGSEGLERMAKEGEKVGFVLSGIDASKIHAANVAVDRLQALVEAVGKRLAVELSPYIEAAANELAKLGSSGSTMGQKIFLAVELAGKGIGYAADVVQVVILRFEQLAAAATSSWAIVTDLTAKAIDVLNKVPGSIKIDTKPLHDQAAAMAVIALKANEVANKAGKAKWAHESADEFFNAIRDGAQKAAEAAAAAEKANEALPEHVQKNVAGMKEYAKATEQMTAFVAKLNAEIAAGGKSGPEADFQRLSAELTGAMTTAMQSGDWLRMPEIVNSTVEQIDAARDALDQLQQIKTAQAQADYFSGLADKVREAQQAVLGLSESAKIVDDFKRKFKDASPEDLAQAQSQANEIEQAHRLKQLGDEAKRLADAGRSPLEKHAEQLDHLKQALEGGAITWEQYALAVKRSNEELEKASRHSQSFKSIDRANTNLAALAGKDFSFGAGSYVPPAPGAAGHSPLPPTPPGVANAAHAPAAAAEHAKLLTQIASDLQECRRLLQ